MPPDPTLADAAQALLDANPEPTDGETGECVFCAWGTPMKTEHASDCPWVALRAALAAASPPAPTDDEWRCPRCSSPRWVSASLTGPVSLGGKAIRQCVPCGHYSNDPVPSQRPEPGDG